MSGSSWPLGSAVSEKGTSRHVWVRLALGPGIPEAWGEVFFNFQGNCFVDFAYFPSYVSKRSSY